MKRSSQLLVAVLTLTVVAVNARVAPAYYSPALGRFITRDPIGHKGGISLYKYVGDRPVSHGDPSGYCACGSTYFVAAAGEGDGGEEKPQRTRRTHGLSIAIMLVSQRSSIVTSCATGTRMRCIQMLLGQLTLLRMGMATLTPMGAGLVTNMWKVRHQRAHCDCLDRMIQKWKKTAPLMYDPQDCNSNFFMYTMLDCCVKDGPSAITAAIKHSNLVYPWHMQRCDNTAKQRLSSRLAGELQLP